MSDSLIFTLACEDDEIPSVRMPLRVAATAWRRLSTRTGERTEKKKKKRDELTSFATLVPTPLMTFFPVESFDTLT